MTIHRESRAKIINNSSDPRYIHNAWKTYIEEGTKPQSILRPEILSSWERSAKLGVNPFQERVNKNVSTNELVDFKDKNEQLLHYADQDMEFLAEALNGSDTIITISDNHGLLLSSYGDVSALKEAEKINFLPGAVWSEQSAGTNAIGTVIERKQPAHIMFSEHYSVGWHDWFCAGAPILNPFTNELMGVLDLSGRWENTNPHTLGLVTLKANSISNHIERILYHEGLKINPFLMTAIGSLEDGVMITDSKGAVLKANETMGSFLSDITLNGTLKNYPQIKSLIDFVFTSNQSVVEEEVVIGDTKTKCLCTVYPVALNQQNIVGFFVQLKRTKSARNRTLKESTFADSKKESYTFSEIIGSSSVFMNVIQKAKKAANLNTTLLLNGETGTGKELFVQGIHHASKRKNHPFVAINCGAIPRDLIVSELFGYEQGSFTGASKKGSAGKFELANGGTIFLDEIGDMPLEAQVHLLRVLEERVVTRIGGTKAIPVDVRVIAATHRDLRDSIEKGTFRADLFYRLRVIQLNIPSLRERIEDIPDLVHHYISQKSGAFEKESIQVNSEAMRLLQAYEWPGNIRELKNVIEQSLFNMEENVILPTDLPQELWKHNSHIKNRMSEKNRYIEMIQSTGGNISEAAIQLGISRATMYRRIKQMGITRDMVR